MAIAPTAAAVEAAAAARTAGLRQWGSMGVQQSEAMAVLARAEPPAVLAEIYPEPLTVTESPVRSVAAAAGLITILLPGRGATARLPGRAVRIVRQPAPGGAAEAAATLTRAADRKSTRLNSSHGSISY